MHTGIFVKTNYIIMQKECKIHGLTDFSPITRPRCKKCRVVNVQKRRHKVKQMAVDYKGGCCEKCGYNKYVGALEFHHLDPTKKDFAISTNGHCRAWETIKLELDKCIMLCANCHREVHDLGGLL